MSAVAGTATAGTATAGTATAVPLVFTHVSHWYGDVVAVNDISCAVGPGITGLLGPNGAGKSTLLQLAAGILTPSHGTVLVHGTAPASDPAVYRQVALVPEREALPARLSARAFVATRAAMLGIVDVPAAVSRALDLVELGAVASRPIDSFSKGMKQRVKLAAALVHEPRVVLLDEPFNGLDPRQRSQMLALLEARAAAGTAILLSSHILEEIAGVASETLVLLSGRLAASGDYRTIRQLMTDQPHVVRFVTSDDRALAAALMQEPSVLGVALEGSALEGSSHEGSAHEGSALVVRTTDYAALARTVAPVAQRLGCTLYEVQVVDESLEHVFAYLVQR